MDTLGDPMRRPFVQQEATVNKDNDASEQRQVSEQEKVNSAGSNLRTGDNGLGMPNPQVDSGSMRILSELEQQMYAQEEEDILQQRLQDRLAALSGVGWRVPRVLVRYAAYALILLSAVLGLFMLGQGISIYQSILTLPVAGQYLVGAIGGVLVLLIAGVLLRLIFSFFTFRQTPQVNLKALTVLQERVELQVLAEQASKEAEAELVVYLQQYPLNDHSFLYRCGFNRSAINKLQQAAECLLKREKPQAAAEWIAQFRSSFQAELESIARERIKKYAGKVALGTAASPVGVIDQLLVLYGSLSMIRDVLAIYNLRPAFAQSAIMLSRAIMQAYLSGLIGEASESGVETLSDTYEEWTGEVFAGSLSGALKSIFSKTAEAGLNGFLVWRLGKATINYVEMVKDKKS